MNNRTKVSVVVAAYNVEKYIERCIVSVANQTLKDMEIIVVNDGSTDRTREIIEDTARRFDNIIVLNKKNEGVSEARNDGIKRAKSDYIAFVDGDDWIESDMMEAMYEKAVETESDIVICDVFEDYEGGRSNYMKSGTISAEGQKVRQNKEIIVNALPAAWNKLYKRELFVKNEIYYPADISYGEDLATTFRIITRANKVAKIDRALYHYIQRDGSIMRQYKSKIFDIYKVFEIMKRFLDETEAYEEYKDEYEFLFLGNAVFAMLMKIASYEGDKRKALKKIETSIGSKLEGISDNRYYDKLTRNQKLYLFLIKNNIYIAYFTLKLSLKIRGDKNEL